MTDEHLDYFNFGDEDMQQEKQYVNIRNNIGSRVQKLLWKLRFESEKVLTDKEVHKIAKDMIEYEDCKQNFILRSDCENYE